MCDSITCITMMSRSASPPLLGQAMVKRRGEYIHFLRTKTQEHRLAYSADTGAEQLLLVPTRRIGFLSGMLAAAGIPSCPGDHGRVRMRHGANREHHPRLWLPPPALGPVPRSHGLPERRSRFTKTVKTAVLHRQTSASSTACALCQLHISPASFRLKTPLWHSPNIERIH